MTTIRTPFYEIATYRPGHRDNSALRARLSGTKIQDRPIVTELRVAMRERESLATLEPRS